jgi:hypothetical protein
MRRIASLHRRLKINHVALVLTAVGLVGGMIWVSARLLPAAAGDALASAPATPAPHPIPTQAGLIGPGLPDPALGGEWLVCEANAARIELQPPAPAPAGGEVTRLAADETYLYALIDDQLYRLPIDALGGGGPLAVEPLMPAGSPEDGSRAVDGLPMQALADLALDPATSGLYALDKAGHVFRFDTRAAQVANAWSVIYRAAPAEEEITEPQFVALTVDGRGRPILLDTALGRLRAVEPDGALRTLVHSRQLEDGTDVAVSGGALWTLHADGRVNRALGGGTGLERVRGSQAGGPWLALVALPGFDPMAIDGLARRVSLLRVDGGGDPAGFRFVMDGIGLLRDMTLADGRLVVASGDGVVVFPFGAGAELTLGEACASSIDQTGPTLYGQDVVGLLAGFAFPIEGGELSDWARLYPGARRLYRMGVHRGLDIYWIDAPSGFDIGWPVVAAADGQVVSATTDYTPLDEAEWEKITEQALRLGYTPEPLLKRMAGRQVIIEHAGGVRTVYSHLDEIAEGIEPGASVRRGQGIGTVGVSGMQAEAIPGTALAHLHFEVWIGERYLGEGLTLPETMWWWAQAFPEAAP